MKQILFLFVPLVVFATEIEVQEPLRGRSAPGSGEAALSAAKQSHQIACNRWKEETAQTLGTSLTYLTCGFRKETPLQKAVAHHGHNCFYPPYCEPTPGYYEWVTIGYQSTSTATVKFAAEGEVSKRVETIGGESSTQIDTASSSYYQACAIWKKEKKKEFGSRFLYSSCENVKPAKNIGTGNLLQYVSEGTVYFTP